MSREESTGLAKAITENTGSANMKATTNKLLGNGNKANNPQLPIQEHNDFFNYALLICLYTIQGIPMGLSASIPFLIQQKIQLMTSTAAAAAASAAATTATGSVASTTLAASSASAIASTASRLSYNANAIFALCSWPFSLKLLWAPIVDAVFLQSFGRRKSWVVPVQFLAGLLMVAGSDFVENELGLNHPVLSENSMNVKGVTAFFFVLYFLMATQDIAVDGWALTMLSKKNRGRGPVMNSIGQNIGFFLSFVGFLALNDAESSESLWRPLFGLPSRPGEGLVSLGTFIKAMGIFMLVVTILVAIFKSEMPTKFDLSSDLTIQKNSGLESLLPQKHKKQLNEDDELDAAEIGIRETYSRLWAVVQLPSVRWLFLILLTYRLPTALTDNVKFLKAVEYGLSKSTTALLSPSLILPLGIIVPIIGAKIWHGHPLRQFMTAYKVRVTIVPILDILMLLAIKNSKTISKSFFWIAVVLSTAMQAIVNSLQFNAQMTFFASRVDPAIGGSYMTCLNTAANLGGTWPSSVIMYLVGHLTVPPTCTPTDGGGEVCVGGRDAYIPLQIGLAVLGISWIFLLGKRVEKLAALPDDAWRTHLLDNDIDSVDIEADSDHSARKRKTSSKHE
jgi:MFS transporter, PAT family, solute carrier family 33 (acetyl-CoA transportor), member 1